MFEKESSKINRILLILIAVLLVACLFLACNLKKINTEQEQYLAIVNDLAEIDSIIEKNCLYSPDRETAREGILTGAVSSLDDPYSVYLNPANYQTLNDSISGTFFGVGFVVTLDRETKYPKIVSVYDNCPAQKSGLQAQDLIVEVDGEDICGQDLDLVVSKIKGKKGTEVKLKAYRESEQTYLEVTCTREKIEVINVEGKRLADNLGYVHLMQFNENSGDEVEKMLEKLQKEGKLEGIVLDLRNNTGGSFAAALDVSSLFIPKGPVVYVEDKNENQQAFETTRQSWDLPVVVLTNAFTASSSEIVSGAIRDTGAGKLVGGTTFGKGLVQTVFKLEDGGALKLTTARYLTPNKVDVNKVGLVPDVEIEDDLDTEADEQLEKAQQILLEMIHK